MRSEPTLGRRAWQEAAVGAVVGAAILMCVVVALGTIALSWGAPLNGMTSACINAGPPAHSVPEGASLGAEHSWLPLGVTCLWSFGESVVVQGPGWGPTITVASTVVAAAIAAFYLRSYLRR